MASKSQKKRGALIPNPVTGYDLLCVSLKIPNDQLYIAAFHGAINTLTKAYFWDMSHTAGDIKLRVGNAEYSNIYV